SQVLLNLLNNAFDAVENEKERWVHLGFSALNENEFLLFVTDSGPGIPKEVADKIMQPFFTTKPVGKGTGLGLSISLGVINEHKGQFYINTANKNTQFVLRLPYHKTKETKVA
ncbi:MAG: sensor histidine kinase, partial [Pseudobdellovibrionaceae bacterium]